MSNVGRLAGPVKVLSVPQPHVRLELHSRTVKPTATEPSFAEPASDQLVLPPPAVGFTRAKPPPPLDFAQLSVPYYPTWDVLRRMRSSDRPIFQSALESVVDMGAFYERDDECEALYDLPAKKTEELRCAGPARALLIYIVVCALALAFMVHLGRAREPMPFVRDGV